MRVCRICGNEAINIEYVPKVYFEEEPVCGFLQTTPEPEVQKAHLVYICDACGYMKKKKIKKKGTK